jgi:hypothetical protein
METVLNDEQVSLLVYAKLELENILIELENGGTQSEIPLVVRNEAFKLAKSKHRVKKVYSALEK